MPSPTRPGSRGSAASFEKRSRIWTRNVDDDDESDDENDDDEKEAFEAERAKFYDDHAEEKAQVDQAYSSAGDKYRLTLINISAVEG